MKESALHHHYDDDVNALVATLEPCPDLDTAEEIKEGV